MDSKLLKKRKDRAAQARGKRCKELLKAATRVSARKGYRAASINDVINAAGVARGTFYLLARIRKRGLLITRRFTDGLTSWPVSAAKRRGLSIRDIARIRVAAAGV